MARGPNAGWQSTRCLGVLSLAEQPDSAQACTCNSDSAGQQPGKLRLTRVWLQLLGRRKWQLQLTYKPNNLQSHPGLRMSPWHHRQGHLLPSHQGSCSNSLLFRLHISHKVADFDNVSYCALQVGRDCFLNMPMTVTPRTRGPHCFLSERQASVELFYRLNHARQTVDFVKRQVGHQFCIHAACCLHLASWARQKSRFIASCSTIAQCRCNLCRAPPSVSAACYKAGCQR